MKKLLLWAGDGKWAGDDELRSLIEVSFSWSDMMNEEREEGVCGGRKVGQKRSCAVDDFSTLKKAILVVLNAWTSGFRTREHEVFLGISDVRVLLSSSLFFPISRIFTHLFRYAFFEDIRDLLSEKEEPIIFCLRSHPSKKGQPPRKVSTHHSTETLNKHRTGPRLIIHSLSSIPKIYKEIQNRIEVKIFFFFHSIGYGSGQEKLK